MYSLFSSGCILGANTFTRTHRQRDCTLDNEALANCFAAVAVVEIKHWITEWSSGVRSLSVSSLALYSLRYLSFHLNIEFHRYHNKHPLHIRPMHSAPIAWLHTSVHSVDEKKTEKKNEIKRIFRKTPIFFLLLFRSIYLSLSKKLLKFY